MKTTLLSVLLLAASAGASEPSASGNLKVSFKLRGGKASHAGNFVTSEGSQTNYVVRDGKKQVAVVNCAFGAVDARTAQADCQFELSGPEAAMLQFQTSFMAPLRKPVVLIDEPERRIELTVERL